MTSDLVIKNGKIASPYGIIEGGLAVVDGRIVAIAKSGHLPKADRVIDAEGKILMPGAIDVHTHLTFGKLCDFTKGTMSAANGGVTTVMEMPLSTPPCGDNTLTLEAFKEKLEYLKGRAVIDYGLYGGGAHLNIEEVPKMDKAGVIGFKMYMGESYSPGFPAIDSGALLEMFRKISELGAIGGVHAENQSIVRFYTEKLKRKGRKEPEVYSKSRPVFAEVEAIIESAMLAREAGAKLHIFHVSSGSGAQAIKRLKVDGVAITAETCPHYLFLDESMYKAKGPYMKINPPIRSSDEVKKLWTAVLDDTIDIIASDDSSYSRDEKEAGWKNIWEAPSGAPGMETMLPLLLDRVNKGVLTLEKLISLVCERPAKTFGIYPRKGVLQVGSDADIVVVNMKRKFALRCEDLYTNSEFILYEGMEGEGVPELVLCRGKVVMENGYPGDVIGKGGHGQFITRKNKL